MSIWKRLAVQGVDVARPHALFDVFVSYRWSDRPWVEALVTALEARRITCWVDRSQVEPFGGITPAVEAGIGASRALLACYSKEYPRGRVCQWELTLAYLAGEGATPCQSRVLVVNPEPDAAHLHLGSLADQLAVPASRSVNPDDHRQLAATVADALESRVGVMAELMPSARPAWIGARLALGSDRFVGRGADLWRLHGMLRGSLDAVVRAAAAGRHDVVCLVGMGGIGKSQLAEEYALRFAAAYPGGVVWLDGLAFSDEHRGGADADALRRQLRAVADNLALPVRDEASVDELRGQVALRLGASGRVLWIVDDLPGGLTRGQLDRWLAPMPGAATIVTTRTTAYRSAIASLEVEALDEPDGVALLARSSGLADAVDLDAAARIVAALGGHPLAIDVSGALLARATAPAMAVFAAQLELPASPQVAELGEELDIELPSGHENSILLTILRSIEQLDDDGLTVMILAAVLGPRPLWISIDLLTAAAGYFVGDVPELGGRVRASCELAVSMSLLRPGGPGSGTVDIHPVVMGVIRHLQAGEIIRAGEAVLNALHDLMSRDVMSPGEVSDGAGRLRTTASHDIAQARYLTTAEPTDELEAIVSSWVAHQDFNEGAYAAAKARAVGALGALEASPNSYDTSADVSRLRSLAAHSMLALGDVAGARTIYQELLEQGYFDDDDPDSLELQKSLASTYLADGDHGRAVEMLLMVVERATQLDGFGPEHHLTLSAKNSLGMALQDAGELDEAAQVLDQVVQTRTRVLGWHHRHTINSRNNLASTLSDLGEVDQARALLQEVLQDRRRQLGVDHPDTVQSINNLARVTQDPDEAANLYREAIAAYTRILGPAHYETLASISNLAAVLARQLRLDEAAALFEEVAEGRRVTLGSEHPRTESAKSALAVVERQRAIIRRGQDNPALAQRVAKWLAVSSWPESVRYLHEHPELADGRAESLLSQLLADTPDDEWLAEHVELLGEVAQAGPGCLADLAHPQRWREVYDRMIDQADAGGLERTIAWRGMITGGTGPDELGHIYVLLMLQNRMADARRLARAITASGPESVAAAMKVLSRLHRAKPKLALAGQILLMTADGPLILMTDSSSENPETT
jgi:tetratricopeptide (TPR) repeat protein